MGSKTKIDWCDYVPQGSRVVTRQGYVLVRCPEHPNASKGRKSAYIFEHRLVMSNHLKRALEDGEVVHHKNGNKSDNRIENLILMTNEEHMRLHGKKQPAERLAQFVAGANGYAKSRKKSRELIPCACGCGTMIEMHDSKGRKRTYAHGHNQVGKHWKWGVTSGI